MKTLGPGPDLGVERATTGTDPRGNDFRPEPAIPRRLSSIWTQWVLYTTLGHALVGVLATGTVMRVPGGLMLTPVVAAAGVGLVGLLQWLVLRNALPRVRWTSWVLAAVLGQIAATLAVGAIVVAPLLLGALHGVASRIGGPGLQLASRLTAGAVLGAVVGLVQWLVLRRHVPAAGWWILAAVCANAIAAVIPPVRTLDTGLGTSAVPIVDRLFYGLVVGSITGAALVWLLWRSRAAGDAR